jgi:hypothetical protein
VIVQFLINGLKEFLEKKLGQIDFRSTIPPGSFVNAGLFPNDLITYKKYLNEIKEFFTLKNIYVQEAKER